MLLLSGQAYYNIIMSKDKNNQEIDLKNFNDHESLSTKKLNFGLWLSENRKAIDKIIVFCLIGISIFFFSYSTYNYIVYFFSNDKTENNNLINVVAPKNQVTNLIISNTQAIKINGVYDLVSSIDNVNERFRASFDYCFKIEDQNIFCDQGFILPKEQKYLIKLNQKIEVANFDLVLELTNISWERIDIRSIPDWAVYFQERFNFILSELSLNSSGDRKNSDNLNSLSFKITNQSAYSYYEVPLNIVFYKGENLIGAHRHIITNFLSGETENINLSWVSNLAGVTRTEIRPEINILDDNVYLKYQGN